MNEDCVRAVLLHFHNVGTFWVRVLFQYPCNGTSRAFFHAWQEVIIGPHRQGTVRVSSRARTAFTCVPDAHVSVADG